VRWQEEIFGEMLQTDFKQKCVTSWTKLFVTNEVQFTDNAIGNSKMQDITDVVRILRNFS